MKEVMIEEAKQNNVDLTPDDIKKIEEKIEQKTQSESAGQDNYGAKTNNGQGNGGEDKNSNGKSSSEKSNNGKSVNKGNSNKS